MHATVRFHFDSGSTKIRAHHRPDQSILRATVPTYYDVLQVERNAPAEQIRRAYKRMAQRYHPDKSPDNVYAPRVMANLNKAYEVLSDPARREEHDRWIATSENPPLRHRYSAATLKLKPWPWYLLFATISCAVASIGTVLYLSVMSSRAAPNTNPSAPRVQQVTPPSSARTDVALSAGQRLQP